ncbi:protein LAX PANICLE 2 isoform X3 [Cucumis melo]|uniref:Protein LAX PANICLE 2 isoform X3 n=1 Tax=Cucumis melo TaxID=3656 RepID=A0ABM3KZX6_CUCME|nr:protein LAX PANICLE 2 isoform X3 [Cucumis melo]
MTMVAALNHFSKHQHGGADHLMNGGAPLYDGWLQLSIGGSGGSGNVTGLKHDQRESMTPGRSSGLVELDLLPGGGRDISMNYSRWVSDFSSPETTTTSKTETGAEIGIGLPLFFGTSSSSNFVQQEINWAFRPVAGIGTGVPSSSSPSTSAVSSSYSLPISGRRSSYLGRPLIQLQSVGVDTATATAGPSSDVRIINPPRRPHSGIWFTLKALENQGKEPFLPQISKNYLRIKDEKMTVSLVMKYLVNKLHLDSESEIEIRCRGQELVPFWTMQYVRDRIWNNTSSNSLFTLLPQSSTTNHLMLLHYGRKN